MRDSIFKLLLIAPLTLSAETLDERLTRAECEAARLSFGNPPAYVCQPCPPTTFFFAEWFFASPREDGLAFALKSTVPLNFTSTGSDYRGKYIEPGDQWRPGFRVGFGSHLRHDDWELTGSWTYFRSNLVRTIHAPAAPAGTTYLVPLFIDSSAYGELFPANSVQEAKQQWVLAFNTLQFDLSRAYSISRQLAIRPQAGFLSAWIHQKADMLYRSNNPAASSVATYGAFIENDSWNAGPFLGTTLDWFIRRKFRVFGKAQGAILYRHLDFEQNQASIGAVDDNFRLALSESTRRMRPWLSTQLGLAWAGCINHSRHFIEAAIQYETQFWWHEFESRVLYESIAESQERNLNQYGDLSLQSVALHLRLGF